MWWFVFITLFVSIVYLIYFIGDIVGSKDHKASKMQVMLLMFVLYLLTADLGFVFGELFVK